MVMYVAKWIVYYKKGLTTEQKERLEKFGWNDELYYGSGATYNPKLTKFDVLSGKYVMVAVETVDDIAKDGWCEQDVVFSRYNTTKRLTNAKELGTHSSMSVGEVLVDEQGRFYQCADEGWEEILN